MTSFLSNFASSAVLTLLLGGIFTLLVFVPAVARIYRRYGFFHLPSVLLVLCATFTAIGLLAFTLVPFPLHDELVCRYSQITDYWQLLPFSFLQDFHTEFQRSGALGFLTSRTLLQVSFNIVLFVPLGFVLRALFRLKFAQTALCGLLASLAIETAQGSAIFGAYPCPYRVADIDDLMINTFGAVAGYWIAQSVSRFFKAPNVRSRLSRDITLTQRSVAVGLDGVTLILLSTMLEILAQVCINAMGLARAAAPLLLYKFALGVAIIVLFLIFPAGRQDNATLGQASVGIGLGAPEGRLGKAIIMRGLGRWGGLVVSPLLFVVISSIELVTAMQRPSKQSWISTLSGARTVTTW